MYMRRKVCHGYIIAITGRTGGCRVDSPRTVSNMCCSVDTDYLAQISRFWKAVYMNLPNAFRTRGSSLVRRNLNALLDSISQFSYFVDILENILLRSWSYILQMNTFCSCIHVCVDKCNEGSTLCAVYPIDWAPHMIALCYVEVISSIVMYSYDTFIKLAWLFHGYWGIHMFIYVSVM